jgi:hypothetical protein
MVNRKSRSTGTGVCARCNSPKPPGRGRYCSDECWGLAVNERERLRRQERMVACSRCGGQKELGTRGSKYCAECRRVNADTSALLEQVRGRRKVLRRIEERLAAGEHISRRTIDTPEGHKWCPKCQEFRPKTSFPYRKEGTKPAPYCKPCQKIYSTSRRMLITFGLSWDDFELLFACQEGKCAICGNHPRSYMLAVDHDHKTGEIRGLLCRRCNHRLLGSANDDPARLRRAADYLEQYEAREVFGEPRYVPGSQPLNQQETA